MRKVIIRIIGGLGNQLFCYAAARRLAIVNDCELVIDHISGFKYDKKYRRRFSLDKFNIPCRKATPAERLEPFSRVRRFLLKRANKLIPFENRNYIVQEKSEFDPRLLKFRVRRTTFIEGYWQSELYFKDIERVIRDEFVIVPPEDNLNKEMAKRINSVSEPVAIHIRFFDKPGETNINNLPSEYYEKAISYIESHIKNAYYFVFSDFPREAMKVIKFPINRTIFIDIDYNKKNEFADLWLMKQCKHFIIANSTFSWWGAWLCENSSKIIVAPGIKKQNGIGSWGFKGLLPKTWVTL